MSNAPRTFMAVLLTCLGLAVLVWWFIKSPTTTGPSDITTPEPSGVRSDAARPESAAADRRVAPNVPSPSPPSSPDDTFSACLTLATEGTESTTRQLISSIMNEADETHRYKLVQTLQAVTNSGACSVLYDALTNEQVNGCLLLALVDAVPRLATPDVAHGLVESCRNADPEDSSRDWLLRSIADLRGDAVIAECGTLLATETNLEIQVSLAAALIQDGRPDSLDALVEKIELSGSTNQQDQLVVMVSGVSQGGSLDFLIEEFQSTTNPVIKWATGSAISRIRHLDR